MKIRWRKSVSLLLTVLMVLSIFTVIPVTTAGAATDSYVKVTAAPTDWSGDYLIVYEEGNVAFNGGLGTLDATSNTIEVTIDNNEIAADEITNAAKFTIAESDSSYTIKSASGYYIGNTSDSNTLKSDNSTAYKTILSRLATTAM